MKTAALPLIIAACLLAASTTSCSGKGGKPREGPAQGQAAAGQKAGSGAPAPGGAGTAASPDTSLPVLQMEPAAASGSVPEAGQQARTDAAAPADSGVGAPQAALPAEPSPQESALAPAILAERGFGFAAPLGPILPEDSLIGPLQDWRSKKETEQGALKAAAAFLDGLVAGRLPEDLVTPGRLPIVSMLARDILAGPRPLSCRIGAFQVAGEGGEDSTTARICLAYPAAAQAAPGTPTLAETSAPPGREGETRWLTGEIGLRRIKGIWYIESVTFADAPS